MIRPNIHEAKTHLSCYLATLEQGETVLLCKHNISIAGIHPLPKPAHLAASYRTFAADRSVELLPQLFEPLF